MNKVTVKFRNVNKNRRHNGRRVPNMVNVTVDVNPRKGHEDAVMCAAKLAQFRFGKVKLVSFTS